VQVDGAQGGAEFGGGLGLVGGQERVQQPVVQLAQVLGHERDHLPARLQNGHVGVEVDPAQALDVQLHMSAEDLVHRHHTCAHDTPPHPYAREDEPRHAN
jgi:hypothetical protein